MHALKHRSWSWNVIPMTCDLQDLDHGLVTLSSLLSSEMRATPYGYPLRIHQILSVL